jgi:hypothetical protein
MKNGLNRKKRMKHEDLIFCFSGSVAYSWMNKGRCHAWINTIFSLLESWGSPRPLWQHSIYNKAFFVNKPIHYPKKHPYFIIPSYALTKLCFSPYNSNALVQLLDLNLGAKSNLRKTFFYKKRMVLQKKKLVLSLLKIIISYIF